MTTTTRVGTVRVRLFARYAEVAGLEDATLTLPLPATVGDVVRRARETWPAVPLPERPLVAVNLRHARLETPVADGDEVALLPPLAGG